MAAVQTEYGNMKAEPKDIAKLKKKVEEVFRKPEYRCACGGSDYDVLHPKTWALTPPNAVQVNCNRCGRKNYFDPERLSKFVEEHYG